jgi:membrane protein implicated in regulation of membrane protease activity
MCVGIGYLVIVFPLIAIVAAVLVWKYRDRTLRPTGTNDG